MRIGDALVVVLALALALLPLFFSRAAGRQAAVISVNGAIIYRAPLPDDARIQAGSDNTVLIRDGEITMAEAGCPDGLCLKMHARRPGESVICLPNRIAAWVEGEGGLDGLAY